ncbi:MAG: chemotaxis-specific protein-glutamate methyltransferase CheB [Verrucomicrobiota bacterium]
MIKVMVVDDSAVARDFLAHLINSTEGMTVVGTAGDGVEALERVDSLKPDLITMDIIMPRMGGPEAIERIMQTHPTPIVVVTGNTITEEVRATFESLESGALAIVPRPYGADSHDHEASAKQLLQTIRLMSEVRVVRRWKPGASRSRVPMATDRSVESPKSFRVVAIGASTGGPTVLKQIITDLRADFPAPILVVQHIAAGFVEGFVSWLGDSCHLPVQIAQAGERLLPGRVYVAPDGLHLGVDFHECVTLTPDRLTALLCPSVSHLFQSIARTYGSQAIGVLLTGMGRDGAEGLLQLKQLGAITIAQDKESSVVHGMPGEAIKLGAADFVLPPGRIAEVLTRFAAAATPSIP